MSKEIVKAIERLAFAVADIHDAIRYINLDPDYSKDKLRRSAQELEKVCEITNKLKEES